MRRVPRFACQLAALVAASTGASACGHVSVGVSTNGLPAHTTSSILRLPDGITKFQIAYGDSVFHHTDCRRCHGTAGAGSPDGPSVRSAQVASSVDSVRALIKIITNGVRVEDFRNGSYRLPMPPRGGTEPPLTDGQVRAVAAYIWSLSHKH